MSNPEFPSEERTKIIPIQDDNLSLPNLQNAPVTFDLGPVLPQKSSVKAEELPQKKIPETHHSTSLEKNQLIFGITPPPLEHNSTFSQRKNQKATTSKLASHKTSLGKGKWPYKIWHLLEFVSLTAAIFMVFFLVMNFDSYSQLFVSKLNQLKGNVDSNPYTQQEQQLLKNSSPESQKPLPIVQNPEAQKKQFPMIDMEIAPPDDRIIIPRIDQNVPVVRVPTDKLIQKDWAALEGQIQDALRHGVVHFPGTAMPGEGGNIVITGHSSYFPWDPGRFKDVFALLHQVNIGDQIIVYHEQKKYLYRVEGKEVVKPSQVDVLTQNGEDKLTLITCTPVGTALNRLVIVAKPVLAN